MACYHATSGWDKFEVFVKCLETLGVSYTQEELLEGCSRGSPGNPEFQPFRKATFTTISLGSKKPIEMVAEEYLGVNALSATDGSQIEFEVYKKGHRPDLESRTKVLEPW